MLFFYAFIEYLLLRKSMISKCDYIHTILRTVHGHYLVINSIIQLKED